jgi:CheY-like chemotaxis protein
VENGQQAVRYLEGSEVYSDRARYPLPCLLLLDLKMPIMGGFDVLEWLRQRPELSRSLPVVVLTSSDQEEDATRSFELGARDYFVKPVTFKALLSLVLKLKEEWLEPLSRGEQPARTRNSNSGA